MRTLLTVAFLVLVLALPAGAHSWSELNTWLDSWHLRFDHAFAYATGRRPATIEQLTLLAGVLAEYDDMLVRHPGWDGGYLTAPPPRPASKVYRGMGDGNVERWRSLVAAYFPAGDVDRALCLMRYESGGNPYAWNPTSKASGLMQVMYSRWGPPFGLRSRTALDDPAVNLRIARFIRDAQGWTAWSPYNRGLCR